MNQDYAESRTINLGDYESTRIEYGVKGHQPLDLQLESEKELDSFISSELDGLVKHVRNNLDRLERELRLLKFKEYLYECGKKKTMTKSDLLLELKKYNKSDINDLTLRDLKLITAYRSNK